VASLPAGSRRQPDASEASADASRGGCLVTSPLTAVSGHGGDGEPPSCLVAAGGELVKRAGWMDWGRRLPPGWMDWGLFCTCRWAQALDLFRMVQIYSMSRCDLAMLCHPSSVRFIDTAKSTTEKDLSSFWIVKNLIIIRYILIQKYEIINMTCAAGIDLVKVLNMDMLMTRKASSTNMFNTIVKTLYIQGMLQWMMRHWYYIR
jgi:hypothetical protein